MDKLKERVHRLLRNKPDTRESYRLLYMMIWEDELHVRYNLPLTQLGYVLGSYKHYKLTEAESVTRCARKLVEEYPELANEETQAKRREREEAMRNKYRQRPSHPTRYNTLGGE